MYTYKNDNQIFSEILAYGGYEATNISMDIYSDDDANEKFLFIKSKDGGLSSNNLSVLKDLDLGNTSGQNISYMGAGSRTAAAQWSKNCGIESPIFGICDSDNCIIYKCSGEVGLQIVDYDGHYFKTYGFPVNEEGNTYWILPWIEKDEEWNKKLLAHLKFIYNERLTSGSLKLTVFDNNIKPTNNMFKNPTPLRLVSGKNILTKEKLEFFSCIKTKKGIEKIGESMEYKSDIFKSHTNWKVSLKHTRQQTICKSKNKNGNCGKSLLITNQENNVRLHFHMKEPGAKGNPEKYLYDDNCNDFGKFSTKFNEEFNFSFEIMTIAGNNINARRKAICEEYKLGKPGRDVHAVRILMKGSNGSNFVSKHNIGDNERGHGKKYGCIINIELDSSQYKKYAKPNINRNNQWDCNPHIKEIGDALYEFICSVLSHDFYRRLQAEQEKIKEEENKKKELEKKELEKQKMQERLDFAQSNIDSLLSIQTFGRLILFNYRVEERIKRKKAQELEVQRQKKIEKERLEREKKEKEKKKEEYEERIQEFIESQEKQRGLLYIRQTKYLTSIGIKYVGKAIIQIGMTRQEAENRRNQYNSSDPLPEEDRDEVMEFYECYNIKKAEDGWKNRMNTIKWNYKDVLYAKHNMKVTGVEWYIADLEDIKNHMNIIIKQEKACFESLLNQTKKDLQKELDYYPE